MGEMADAILNGEFCQVCGEYIGSGDGFPVSCPGCSDEVTFETEIPADYIPSAKEVKKAKSKYYRTRNKYLDDWGKCSSSQRDELEILRKEFVSLRDLRRERMKEKES